VVEYTDRSEQHKLPAIPDPTPLHGIDYRAIRYAEEGGNGQNTVHAIIPQLVSIMPPSHNDSVQNISDIEHEARVVDA
jgi:hypothetical protein